MVDPILLVIDDDEAPYPEEEVVRLRLENIGRGRGWQEDQHREVSSPPAGVCCLSQKVSYRVFQSVVTGVQKSKVLSE